MGGGMGAGGGGMGGGGGGMSALPFNALPPNLKARAQVCVCLCVTVGAKVWESLHLWGRSCAVV